MTQKQRILVIDDDRVTHGVFTEIAKMIQLEVDVAQSGAAGLEQIKSQSYGLIFLDLNMPGMNGIEVLRALRAQGISTPVYIITGFYAEYIDMLQGLADEGISFELLRKPLQTQNILNVIQGVMHRH